MLAMLGKNYCMSEKRDTFKMRSEDNWDAAVLCQREKKYSAAANRYYYSFYHAVVYWADMKHLIRCYKSHAGFHQSLPEYLLNNVDRNGKDYRGVFAEIYSLRIQADYKLHPVVEKHLRPELLRRANFIRQEMLRNGV